MRLKGGETWNEKKDIPRQFSAVLRFRHEGYFVDCTQDIAPVALDFDGVE